MTDFTKLSPEELSRVTTRDGRKVRILCTDGPGNYPVAAWTEGSTSPVSFADDGHLYRNAGESPSDLILPPAERVVWLVTTQCGVLAQDSENYARAAIERGGPWKNAELHRITLGPNPKIERV